MSGQQRGQEGATSQPPHATATAPQVHASVLPAAVRPEKPQPFEGQMDGDTIQTFKHKIDLYFALIGLQDGVQQALLAATLLTKSAYTWYVAQGYDQSRTTWLTLKGDFR